MAKSEPNHADARCLGRPRHQSLGGKKAGQKGPGGTQRPTAILFAGTTALPVRASGARRPALRLIGVRSG
jgi:hypothetical protein